MPRSGSTSATRTVGCEGREPACRCLGQRGGAAEHDEARLALGQFVKACGKLGHRGPRRVRGAASSPRRRRPQACPGRALRRAASAASPRTCARRRTRWSPTGRRARPSRARGLAPMRVPGHELEAAGIAPVGQRELQLGGGAERGGDAGDDRDGNAGRPACRDLLGGASRTHRIAALEAHHAPALDANSSIRALMSAAGSAALLVSCRRAGAWLRGARGPGPRG